MDTGMQQLAMLQWVFMWHGVIIFFEYVTNAVFTCKATYTSLQGNFLLAGRHIHLLPMQRVLFALLAPNVLHPCCATVRPAFSRVLQTWAGSCCCFAAAFVATFAYLCLFNSLWYYKQRWSLPRLAQASMLSSMAAAVLESLPGVQDNIVMPAGAGLAVLLVVR
jgi:hypothetical protein